MEIFKILHIVIFINGMFCSLKTKKQITGRGGSSTGGSGVCIRGNQTNLGDMEIRGMGGEARGGAGVSFGSESRHRRPLERNRTTTSDNC